MGVGISMHTMAIYIKYLPINNLCFKFKDQTKSFETKRLGNTLKHSTLTNALQQSETTYYLTHHKTWKQNTKEISGTN